MMKIMGGSGTAAAGTPRSQSPDALARAVKTWRSFDWTTKASQWETMTSENKESREASLAARKQLAEATKLLKRAVKTVESSGKALTGEESAGTATATTVKAIEGVSKQVRATVKSYQGE